MLSNIFDTIYRSLGNLLSCIIWTGCMMRRKCIRILATNAFVKSQCKRNKAQNGVFPVCAMFFFLGCSSNKFQGYSSREFRDCGWINLLWGPREEMTCCAPISPRFSTLCTIHSSSVLYCKPNQVKSVCFDLSCLQLCYAAMLQ